MYRIKEAVIVEGTYDKIKLSGFIDGVILPTHGFRIFSDKGMMESIKTLSEKTGIVILTDSDTAGFRIRSYIKQSLNPDNVKHAYIPDIPGKERRKRVAGKEGLLGVEGISEDIILKALIRAGCELDGSADGAAQRKAVTKADLYALGFSGGGNSSLMRRELLKRLGLPAKLSANMLLSAVNGIMSAEEFFEIARGITVSRKQN